VPLTITGNVFFPAINSFGDSWSCNFGQRAFAYTAPSGFKALNTANLPAPLVTKPNTVMDVLTWSGNNASPRSFSGLNFSPDFVWIKCRSDAAGHALYDTVRGVGNSLESNITGAEVNNSQFGYLSAFNSDGFTALIGTYPGYEFGAINMTGRTFVGWTWDAGTSTVSNTQGSITGGAQVRANPTAGFSVVTYTGNGTGGATVGHGLGVAPSFIIHKCRSVATNWFVYHSSAGNGAFEGLNTTAAYNSGSGAFGSTAPTSTVLTTGGDTNTNGRTYVDYCFAPVVGYSNFGSYTGNGSADGPFVYTGFRPRYLCIKSSSFSDQWLVLDAARNAYNVVNLHLHPNLANNESSLDWLDFTANGFKIRTTYSTVNQSSGSFIYFAFAESPFQYARAR
jgi:hypothetical protein